MYTPKAFEMNDPDTLCSFIKAHGFGVLISANDGKIDCTHTPMYLSQDMKRVYGHLAKANPQWQSWDAGSTAKLIFHGPHTYVSPTDYPAGVNVPTWNYTSVSIDGSIKILSAFDEKLRVVEQLVDQYESARDAPWTLDTADEKLMKLLDGIVCFKIQINRIQPKFKLNQNKPEKDQRRVIQQLHNRGTEMDAAVADLMEANLKQGE